MPQAKSDTLQYFYEPKADSIIKPEVIFPGLENVSYHINKDGFNQYLDISVQKDPRTFRIMTIGDSHTFGQNVNTEENYPSQFQKLLNEKLSCPEIRNFEVLNLGVPGYDFEYTVERFKLRGQKYNPDLVIWLVVSDNLRRINEQLRPKMHKYKEEARKNGEYEKQIANGDYYAQWNRARDEVEKEMGGKGRILLLQKTHLEQLSTYFSGKLVFTTYANTLSDEERQLLSIVSEERNNTLFFDQLPNIYELESTLLPDRHLNKKGYSVLATSLLEHLVDTKVFPCSFR